MATWMTRMATVARHSYLPRAPRITSPRCGVSVVRRSGPAFLRLLLSDLPPPVPRAPASLTLANANALRLSFAPPLRGATPTVPSRWRPLAVALRVPLIIKRPHLGACVGCDGTPPPVGLQEVSRGAACVLSSTVLLELQARPTAPKRTNTILRLPFTQS